MLQRVQTIYLVIVIGLLCGFLYMPIAELTSVNFEVYVLKLANPFLLKDIASVNLALRTSQVLAWVLIALNAVVIFLYKSRKMQMNLCMLGAVLLVVLNLTGVFLLHELKLETDFMINHKVIIIFPAIGAVFSYLAFRGIKKDDELVKSYDRLR